MNKRNNPWRFRVISERVKRRRIAKREAAEQYKQQENCEVRQPVEVHFPPDNILPLRRAQ